jgi:enterochelin esterase-like enzyme
MRRHLSTLVLLLALPGSLCLAQSSQTADANDWKPSSWNQANQEYPQVSSQGYARFRIIAPQAQSVRVNLAGVSLTKGDDGAWVGTTSRPLDEGFHYYHLVIDGATVNDSGTLCFYGIMDNLIAEGKAKPFIIVMESSSVGGGPRGGARRPGAAPAGEPNQARGARAGAPGGRMGGRGGIANMDFNSGFGRVLTQELIPFIDAHYRTLADQPHRAMAGLSMGGMATRQITLANLDKFSHIGIFSGGSISMEDVNNAPSFKDKVKLVFVGYGSRELGNRVGGGVGGDPKENAEALKQAGINSVFYVSPNTAHEWLSWRRDLHEFAPLLFK